MWEADAGFGLDEARGAGTPLGTRFLIYPQAPYVPGYSVPETVWISTPPGRLQTGPADAQMYVSDPLFDKEPYEFPYLPPFAGDSHPPAQASFDGHFDGLVPGTRQFVAAHAFACVRRVLDVWESYLGRPVGWHFSDTYERLEIIPCLDWDNAQSGYGFLELGLERGSDGRAYPFALKFDVIAHEVGHAILFSLFGVPETGAGAGDFGAFHESSADLISLLSFLHFDSGLDRLLRHCNGNLLILNELNRIAELTGDRQIRLASNARRMSEVSGEIHDMSRPFTGAVFDTIVDNFHARLVQQGLADERLLAVDVRELGEDTLRRISEFTAAAFRQRPFLFKTALTEARDDVAMALAGAWPLLVPDGLSFGEAALTLSREADARNTSLAGQLEVNFVWRELA